MLERFEAAAGREEDQRRVAALCRHAALALRNAQRHESLPLFRLLHWVAGAACFARARTLPAAVWILIAAAAAAAALRWIPAEFAVEARGELQPKLRRNVFAPHDGVVHRVHVAHADRVAAGDVLVELRQSELELEFARLLGEMQTTRKQLDSVQAGRLQAERSRDAAREDYEQLTAKEEELKRLLESLAAQHAILVAQRDRLKVVSPIAGQVLTWDVAQSLDARPVQRGQALMKVVDPDGPWILELRVPDARIGYVLEAQRRLPRRLGVSFFLAARPGTTYEGGVEEVTMATELDEQGQPYVLVTAEIDGRGIAQRRPGATVLARIHCGRRSLGYVWFHDLMEFLWRVLW